MESKVHIEQLDLSGLEKGKIHKLWFDVVSDSFGSPISIPLLIAKGLKKGIVLGLTAAVHGNELNGIPAIQRLFKEINPRELRGTIVGVPVVNFPSFVRKRRRFIDGNDLNHIMPGKENGNVSQVYSHRFFNQIIRHLDYLIDLHTASEGRINSYYVRADLSDDLTKKLALLQNAQIIVDNPPSDGTLRGAASAIGITAITLEVGNPNTFQRKLIRSGITGLHNAIIYLDMLDGNIEEPENEPLICKTSYWMYTKSGGLLNVLPDITDYILKGDLVAVQNDIFGDRVAEYHSSDDGIVIGKSISPVNQSGGRILHLGILR